MNLLFAIGAAILAASFLTNSLALSNAARGVFFIYVLLTLLKRKP